MIIETTSLQVIENVCKSAQRDARIIGLLGEPGFGKTTCLQEFKTNNKHVYLVTIGKSFKKHHIYTEVLQQVVSKKEPLGTDMYDLIRKLATVVRKSNKNILIIIDEGGKLGPKHLEYLHELIDLTRGKCGIIISGPPYVRRNIVKWKNDDRAGVAEFYRRVNEWVEISKPESGELKEICKENRIEDEGWIEKAIEESESFSDIQNKIQSYKIELEAKKKGLKQS